MAKMFYSLQETAEKLGVSEDDIREMASAGKLQQFRDRDKLMFKRDQVDAIRSCGGRIKPSDSTAGYGKRMFGGVGAPRGLTSPSPDPIKRAGPKQQTRSFVTDGLLAQSPTR